MLRLALIAAALSLSAAPHPSGKDAAVQKQSANQVTSVAQPIASSGQELAEPAQYKQPCSGTAKDRESDLCAQWQAANAAADSARWAMVATLIAILGTIGLIATVIQGRNGLKQARKVTKAELRPYLFVEHIETEMHSERIYRCTVWFKNYGRTPARNIRAYIKCYMSESVSDLREFAGADLIELAVAAPGHTRRAFPIFNFTEEEWATPTWAFNAIIRIFYLYTDESGDEFSDHADYFTGKFDLDEEETTFFLLTEGAQRSHIERRERSKDLFDPDTIRRVREDALRVKRAREKQEQQKRVRQLRGLAEKELAKRKPKAGNTKRKPAAKSTGTKK